MGAPLSSILLLTDSPHPGVHTIPLPPCSIPPTPLFALYLIHLRACSQVLSRVLPGEKACRLSSWENVMLRREEMPWEERRNSLQPTTHQILQQTSLIHVISTFPIIDLWRFHLCKCWDSLERADQSRSPTVENLCIMQLSQHRDHCAEIELGLGCE